MTASTTNDQVGTGTAEGTNDQVGAIEARGIEPVPDKERHGHAGQLFRTWSVADISVPGPPLGATLDAFRGLNKGVVSAQPEVAACGLEGANR